MQQSLYAHQPGYQALIFLHFWLNLQLSLMRSNTKSIICMLNVRNKCRPDLWLSGFMLSTWTINTLTLHTPRKSNLATNIISQMHMASISWISWWFKWCMVHQWNIALVIQGSLEPDKNSDKVLSTKRCILQVTLTNYIVMHVRTDCGF